MKIALVMLFIFILGISHTEGGEKEFEKCRQKLKKAQKIEVLHNMESAGGIVKITVGKTFFSMPIEGKQGFCDTVNCFLSAGEKGKYINFNLYDWRNGKRVGQYFAGKISMD